MSYRGIVLKERVDKRMKETGCTLSEALVEVTKAEPQLWPHRPMVGEDSRPQGLLNQKIQRRMKETGCSFSEALVEVTRVEPELWENLE